MTIKIDYKVLSPQLLGHCLVLTPNSRTQKAVFAGRAIQLSEGSVEKAVDVRSMSQWQNDLWSELSFSMVLPKRIGKSVIKIWLEKLIEAEQEWSLTNPAGVAGKVLEAYQNLSLWELGLSDVERNQSTEIDFFVQWMQEFEAFSEEKGLLAEFATLPYLVKHFEKLEDCLPEKLILVGFNQLTPVDNHFLSILKESGVEVIKYDQSIHPEPSYQVCFDSLKDELSFAASYAFKHQKDGESVGIVVDQLANHLPDVHQQFSQVFQRDEDKPWLALSKPDYNVSAGLPFAEQPVASAALKLLEFKKSYLKQEEIHLLKNTPFIDWGDEAKAIKYFLHQLCLQSRKRYSMDYLMACINSDGQSSKLTQLTTCLKLIARLNPNKQPIDRHIEQWKQLLMGWHWAHSDLSLNEFELQAKQRFINLLNDCKSLADVYETVNHTEALDFLKSQIIQQTFQVASDRSHVHVLGILEASGLQFDHLVLVGFSRDTWPQKNKINPFLPLEFQREHNMPGSSAEREYNYSLDLSDSLLNASKQLVVTSSFSESSHQNNMASFFAHLAEKQVVSNVSVQDDLFRPDYQWVEDSQVDLSSQTIKGGAYLLSDYSKCPFMAVAKYQVKLNGYQKAELGVEPKSKGTWLHEAMELIWLDLKSSEALAKITNDELTILVEASLTETLKKNKAYMLSITDEEVIQLEFEKLKNLIIESMKIESRRGQFEIDALEEPATLSLGQLQLNFRIDRLDRNSQEQLEIIDYKTGTTNINNWFGVRPTEAQMPAYVLAKEQQVHSIPTGSLLYSRIKTGEVALSGLKFVSEEPQILTSFMGEYDKEAPERNCKQINFETLKSNWKNSLTRLATGIASGYIPVSPKDKKACLYCEYKSVCRIDEEQTNV
ncbi:MAG: PD-(D/E)XK nuclease family protein [Kangiellaceae bacterium]|nr:PD-(D/E)XK nuclease family protein [Kangiellaceae bacterium]